MFEGGYRNRERITVPNKGYGVVIIPEPTYEFPAGHPCRGCLFTFRSNKPSCMTGSYPDTENCVNAFYKKIQARHRAEHEAKYSKED